MSLETGDKERKGNQYRINTVPEKFIRERIKRQEEIGMELKQPGAGYGPWQRHYRWLHDHGGQSLRGPRAGILHGSGCRYGHHGHGQQDRGWHRCCHRHCREGGAPRGGSARCRPGGGWRQRQQRSRRARRIQRKRSSEEIC